MKRKDVLIFFIFFAVSFHAVAKDTTKVRYVHSYISVNAGYGKNINPEFGGIPWFTSEGLFADISFFKALKESYFGITGAIRYTTSPAFQVGEPAGTYAKFDTAPQASSYKEGYGGYYQTLCLMAGLGLKIPGHTTRYAIELRLLIGPVICQMPAISYTTTYVFYPYPSNPQNIYTQQQPSTFVALGFDAGVRYGYKISKRWGVMANCDVLFADARFSPSITNTPDTYYTSDNYKIKAGMNYLTFTGGVVYTFGKMIGNFKY